MDTLFEHNVTHNCALASFAIAQAAIRYQSEAQADSGLDLFAALLVPPLVLHRRTAVALANKQMTEGLFFRFAAEDRELLLGIQERVMDLADLSFKAIHLGCSTNLFTMRRVDGVDLRATTKSLPSVVDNARTSSTVATIIAAAKRLGYCFATTDLAVICNVLRVRF